MSSEASRSRIIGGQQHPRFANDEHGNTYQLRRLADGSAHEVRKNFPTENELRTAVNDLGMEVKVEFMPYYWVLTYRLPGRASFPSPG